MRRRQGKKSKLGKKNFYRRKDYLTEKKITVVLLPRVITENQKKKNAFYFCLLTRRDRKIVILARASLLGSKKEFIHKKENILYHLHFVSSPLLDPLEKKCRPRRTKHPNPKRRQKSQKNSAVVGSTLTLLLPKVRKRRAPHRLSTRPVAASNAPRAIATRTCLAVLFVKIFARTAVASIGGAPIAWITNVSSSTSEMCLAGGQKFRRRRQIGQVQQHKVEKSGSRLARILLV